MMRRHQALITYLGRKTQHKTRVLPMFLLRQCLVTTYVIALSHKLSNNYKRLLHCDHPYQQSKPRKSRASGNGKRTHVMH